MKRMSDYVRSKGREVIGWDELTNSSFLPEALLSKAGADLARPP